MFNPARRASKMTVGTAVVVLQMSNDPVMFGCAEVVADRLCRATAGTPPVAQKSFNEKGHPQYTLTEYGQTVKRELEKMVCLNVN